MNIKEYFDLPSTPMANSPIGKLMQAIVEEQSGVDFEEARRQAQECLNKAAGRKSYTIYTPAQEARRRDDLNARRKLFKRQAHVGTACAGTS
jgi:hypothetical protein